MIGVRVRCASGPTCRLTCTVGVVTGNGVGVGVPSGVVVFSGGGVAVGVGVAVPAGVVVGVSVAVGVAYGPNGGSGFARSRKLCCQSVCESMLSPPTGIPVIGARAIQMRVVCVGAGAETTKSASPASMTVAVFGSVTATTARS